MNHINGMPNKYIINDRGNFISCEIEDKIFVKIPRFFYPHAANHPTRVQSVSREI